ncbi:phosphotransferase [Nocardioides sp. Root190]|uniref:phosphotransferase n=1 Tax=Nocardioides sp. Root190 TaxID=1736488 RepID=UPI001910B9D5|nr:phosphotransferase [Nocardioides sp. Root190]
MLRVSGVRTRERLRGLAPVTDPAVVPSSVDQLTPEWITGTVGAAVSGAIARSVDLREGSDGTSSRRGITVEWNEAGVAGGLPAHLYTKSTPTLLNRLLVGVTGAAGAEALFYSSIRPHLPGIGAPHGHHGAWDPRTCRSMVVTEDIATARGAVFRDASTMYVDRAAAESMVAEMASYHGAMWEDPRLARDWALQDAHEWQRMFNNLIKFDRGALIGMRLAEEEIPEELHRRKSEIRGGLMRSLEHAVRGPETLLHQDVHPANWFQVPDGTLHLYDWQSIGRGSWALDVAYALSAALTIEDRRAWERDLIELYCDLLAKAGGKPPSAEDAFHAYRQQMLHGFVFWTYTFMVGKLAPLQPEAHVRALISRIGQAMVDLETLDSLDRASAS